MCVSRGPYSFRFIFPDTSVGFCSNDIKSCYVNLKRKGVLQGSKTPIEICSQTIPYYYGLKYFGYSLSWYQAPPHCLPISLHVVQFWVSWFFGCVLQRYLLKNTLTLDKSVHQHWGFPPWQSYHITLSCIYVILANCNWSMIFWYFFNNSWL